MAVIYSEESCTAAGVFTTNLVHAACVKLNRETIRRYGQARAIVINSGNANACTGEQGQKDALATTEKAAACLGIDPSEVLVASTGVIGVCLPMDRMEKGIREACSRLSAAGGGDAALAIMTTDTFPKEESVEYEYNGKTVRIGGMAKGSGMIHPDMATMLAFITTDACISRECLQKAMADSAALSYNMISVDGDTSTNDMALALANGCAGNQEINDPASEAYEVFFAAFHQINSALARGIARDGEGATRLIEVEVTGAPDEEAARKIARSVVGSNLFKAAVFGLDANWGRIFCAAGYSGASFNPDMVDIYLGSQQVAFRGEGIAFDEAAARRDLDQDEVTVRLELNQGQGRAVAWGCDLTYDYVKINASYRS